LQNVQKWLSSISLTVELMNPHSGMNDNNNRRTKATAAIPMAGAIVTAALLLSGLSLIVNYQPVMAQENVTGGVEGGATSGTTDNATSTMGGAAQGGNATTAGGGANQSTSDVRMNIEQARMALQNNDTQGARMYLDMALSALGGGGATQANMTNMTNATTTAGGPANATTGGTEGGATTGGTEGGATTGGNTSGGGGGPLAGIFGG
jgi:hypothetical protein